MITDDYQRLHLKYISNKLSIVNKYLEIFLFILVSFLLISALILLVLIYASLSPEIEKLLGNILIYPLGILIISFTLTAELILFGKFLKWLERTARTRKYILRGLYIRFIQSTSFKSWKHKHVQKHAQETLRHQKLLEKLKSWSKKQAYKERMPVPVSLFEDIDKNN